MTTSETRDLDSLKTDETRRIERKLRAEFPTAEAYRFNSASIRIRILDERFAELSNPDRESLVDPILKELPKTTQADITLLLLLSPGEAKSSLMNLEFQDPGQSGL